jgi:hypothetical protein
VCQNAADPWSAWLSTQAPPPSAELPNAPIAADLPRCPPKHGPPNAASPSPPAASTTAQGRAIDPTNLTRVFATLLRIRCHDLRHSTITLLLERGVELVVIRDLFSYASWPRCRRGRRGRVRSWRSEVGGDLRERVVPAKVDQADESTLVRQEHAPAVTLTVTMSMVTHSTRVGNNEAPTLIS